MSFGLMSKTIIMFFYHLIQLMNHFRLMTGLSKVLTVRYTDVLILYNIFKSFSNSTKYVLLNLTVENNIDVDCVIIQSTENGVQESLDSTEARHEPENVIGGVSSRGPCLEHSVHTAGDRASESTSVGNTSTDRVPTQYGIGACVKRIRIPEQDDGEAPSTSRLRTSESNGKS